MKLACKIAGHRWNGCKCTRCGVMRNENHDWQPVDGKCFETCALCGRGHGLPHQWNGCKCVRCGAVHSEGHKWIPVDQYTERCAVCGGRRPSAYVRQEAIVNGILAQSQGLYDNRSAFLSSARTLTDENLLLRLAEDTRVSAPPHWRLRSDTTRPVH